jgi:hypothetical protein
MTERAACDSPQPVQPAGHPPRRLRFYLLAFAVVVLGLGAVTSTLFGQQLLEQFNRRIPPPDTSFATPPPPIVRLPVAQSPIRLSTDQAHPDSVYQPWFAGPLDATNLHRATRQRIHDFRAFLDLFTLRQGHDDNFTIRVLDRRTNETLEVFELETLRRAWEQGQRTPWKTIDEARRIETTRLTDKYEALGYPRDALTVRWGRKNQVAEARRIEAPFIEYELNLARYLGLSLLVTEIGTVETFNDDRLVSSAGARGRYQMMPALLADNDIHRYTLRTAAGNRIDVVEEWHPLLTMEPSFVLLRGYINAVGHEVPGLSAYHTGPFNIFNVYRLFLEHDLARGRGEMNVMDAYLWAVTEGYEAVSGASSFRTYSRGYVASAYGALQAMQNEPIDPSQTQQAERVQLASGQQISLAALLARLEAVGGLPGNATTYEQFRLLNPHFDLPASEAGVPARGNVLLVASVGDKPVRFFLPPGASGPLRDQGLLDPAATFRFDHTTYAPPAEEEITEADRAYAALVQQIGQFGFTHANRERLLALAAQFEHLAARNPSHYRQVQARIIRTHVQIWRSAFWEKLAASTQLAVQGNTLRLPVRPPDPVEPGPNTLSFPR